MASAELFLVSIIFFLARGLADESDHVHIKLHLPDLLKKHTHVRTVYKHHFHPKKTTHSHIIKSSVGSKLEPENSFSLLNPIFSLPKPNSFAPFDIPGEFWMPQESTGNIINLKGVRPNFRPLNINQNWDTRETISKYIKPHTGFPPQMQIENHKEYDEDEGIPSSIKNIDDDEDEEYMMTEDSIHEQPIAMQMQLKDSDDYGMMLRNNNLAWNRFVHSPKMPVDFSQQWMPYTKPENPFAIDTLDDMHRLEAFRNMMQMQGNLDYQPELTSKRMKSFKRSNKGKNKKRKRLNTNRKVVNSFDFN